MCKVCVYTDEIPGVVIDENGICNYCKLMLDMNEMYPNDSRGEKILLDMVEKMKASGHKRKYDCLVGVSGGCDSSYLLYKMVDYGLRPLAVHFDNTWNSKIATENIHRLTKELDVDLFTIVVNNKEFDSIIKSFLYASVSETNVATDIGLAATLYKAAEKFSIKFQIEGHSFRTESIAPSGWGYMDARYIQSVIEQHGNVKLNTFPNLWLKDQLRWWLFLRIKKLRPLYYMDYNKEEAKSFLNSKFGWQWYGGHHLENKMSQFTHTFLLPRKFGKDQRANGYSGLIRAGQMTREEALILLSSPPEYDPDLIEYFCKRLELSKDEFERVIKLPVKTFRDYKTYKKIFERMRPFFWLMYKLDYVPRSFYEKYTTKNGMIRNSSYEKT